MLSSDLKAASDLLPLDLVGSIVEGLCESGKLSLIEKVSLWWLTGPVEVHYSIDDDTYLDSRKYGIKAKVMDDLCEIPCDLSRGILMGVPTTWTMLNLVHLFWIKRAAKLAYTTPNYVYTKR